MKTASAKAKGRELQKHCAAFIAKEMGLHPSDVVSRPMGSPGPDLIMSLFAQVEFPVTLECKNHKKTPGPDALEQAKHNRYDGTFPAVAWKPPRKSMDETMVMIKLSDLTALIKLMRKQGCEIGKQLGEYECQRQK